MTYRETLLQTHSEEGVKVIVKDWCPGDYFEDVPSMRNCDGGGDGICNLCWDREMPQEEEKAAEGTISAYEAGLSDAWTVLKQFQNFPEEMRIECFGVDCMSDLLEKFTPQQALDKMMQYENEVIHAGDIVEFLGEERREYGMITSIDGENCCGIFSDGNVFTASIFELKKTGRHYDLTSMLEMIKRK